MGYLLKYFMTAYLGLEDKYLSAISKPSLQQYDNYQIYSLICCDYPLKTNTARKERQRGSGAINGASFAYTTDTGFTDYTFTESLSTQYALISYQRYSVTPISLDFQQIASKLLVKPKDENSYKYVESTTTVFEITDNLANGSPDPPSTIGFASPLLDSYYLNLFKWIRLDFRTGATGEPFPFYRRYRAFEDVIKTVGIIPPRLDMLALLNGYVGDTRTEPNDRPKITPTVSGWLVVSYYRQNKLESIPKINSIDWMRYELQVKKNVPITLPIVDVVFGTLTFGGKANLVTDIKSKLTTAEPNRYHWNDYFAENIDIVVGQWKAIYQSLPSSPRADESLNIVGLSYAVFKDPILRMVSANNNVWKNDPFQYQDINFTLDHAFFAVNNERSYNWHIRSQIDNSIGTLIMDSPRTIEIHRALEADKYSVNELDLNEKRITTLGFLLENLARINGLRYDANGDIDLAKEKDFYQPRTLNDASLGLPTSNGKYNDYSLSCWGKIGMIIPHLPTQYNKNGNALQLWDVVHDNQQLALALFRQQDISLSIQHGSEIRVNGLDGKIHCYPNQLAIQLECLQRLEKISYITEKNFLVSTVAGTEVRELFSGIGIPVTQKFMPLKDPQNSKKVLSVPYFGHQKNKPSTAQMLTTVQINLAVINGVLMPKKQPKASITNPFKYFTPNK